MHITLRQNTNARILRQNRLSAAVAAAVLLLLHAGLSRSSAQPAPPDAPGEFLNVWHFDDTNWLSRAGLPPKAFYGLQSVASWQSNAVKIVGTSGLLRYNEIETNGVTNIVCPNGTVWFWFLPNWNSVPSGGSGPGAYGRFIEMGAYTTNASYGWWSLYTDLGGTNLYFSGQTNGNGANYLTAPINWTSNHWHFVALTYSPSNSTLYLDGQPATNGSGVLYWPSATVRATNGFSIGSDSSGLELAQGQFEWMRTYDYPVGADWVSNFYQFVVGTYGGSGDGPSGPGGPDGPGGCVTNGSVYMTNFVLLTNNPVTVAFDIAEGTNSLSVIYDVFGTTNLVGNYVTNSQWVWVTNSYTCQTVVLSNLPAGPQVFVLGTPKDTDGDGITDAYEKLVSKTDPNVPAPPFKVLITQPDPNALLP